MRHHNRIGRRNFAWPDLGDSMVEENFPTVFGRSARQGQSQ
jgi:hypothetical protein